MLPSSTKLARTIIKRSQKQINSSIIQNFKKSSYDQNLDSLGNNTTNNIITKNNVTQKNTISQNPHRQSNSSLVSERQLALIPKNSILGNRKISSEKEKELLDKTNKSKLNKNNRTNQNKTPIPSPTAHPLINKIDNWREINLPKIPKIPIPAPISPKKYPKQILHIQPNNSPSPTPSVMKNQDSEFSGDQFSDTHNCFNYETKPRKRRNTNILNPSTGSYTTHRDKNIITKNHHTPSFLKSDDSSSASNIATQPKQFLRCRKRQIMT